MARKSRPNALPPPYLRKIWFDASREIDWEAYPFCLPIFRRGDFEWAFERPVTILVGENGTGKSTLLEGVAALAGFDEAGGGKGYRPVDHSQAIDKSGAGLAQVWRAAWLPKLTSGWFFRAESHFSVARYLDDAAREAGMPAPDFLSHSHGEGFLRFFTERFRHRALFLLDEPESALSPKRQLEFMKFLLGAEKTAGFQIIMATHSPLLMAYPGAGLLRIEKSGFEPTRLVDTDHFRMVRDFCQDPAGFIAMAMEDADPDA